MLESKTQTRERAGGGTKPTAGLFDELEARGLVHDTSNPHLGPLLDKEPTVVYCGFDPTSDSLQLGNLVPLITLARFQRAGHQPIVVLGGGTGMIGDPSGKSGERNLLDDETIARNIEGQRPQFAKVLDFDSTDNPAILVNNADWLTKLNLIAFLRDVGKSFPVNVMMSRESVKQRIAAKSGISFTEFSYQILQAYDFFHLYSEYGCRLQVGGSDQYGNILAGVDYIRRRTGRDHGAAALTFPLVQSSTGEKLGKTAAGALWLDSERTLRDEWYEYWFNVTDADAVRYLKFFTFLELDEIAEIESRFLKQPKERLAQRKLALEMTALIRGQEEAERAERTAAALYDSGALGTRLPAEGASELDVSIDKLTSSFNLVDALVAIRLAKSNSEAKRLIRRGAVKLNGVKVDAGKRVIGAADVDDDGRCTLAVGSRRRIVRVFRLGPGGVGIMASQKAKD